MTFVKSSRSRLFAYALLAAGLGACATTAPVRTSVLAPGRELRVGIRLGLETIRNDLIVPQARVGAGFGLAMRSGGADQLGVLRAELGFGSRYARASLGRRGVVFDHGLRVRYAFALGGRGWRAWHIGIGPAFGWETDLAYLETHDDARTYAMTNRWLGVTVSAWHDLSTRWRLELAAEVLLVSIQSRPEGHLGREPATLDALLWWSVWSA